MRVKKRNLMAVLSISAVAAFGLAACSTGTSSGDASSEPSMSEESTSPSAEEMDPAAMLVGPGCAGYAEAVPDGDGSDAGMAEDPVATAASNNPRLTQLTAAVSGELNPDVNLVDTLNSGEYTVFAPVDDAFAAVDAATVEALKSDADLLTSILTYHVVEGQVAPDAIVGEHTTLQGGTVEVTGSGDELKVNDANVICGGVTTANATVYLIDGILMPPAE